jgi:hypothetical protein
MQINRAERDALWEHLISDLASTDDFALLLSRGDEDAARRRHERRAEDIRLLNLIGWQRSPDQQTFELPFESDTGIAETIRRLSITAGATLAGALLDADLPGLERLAHLCQVCSEGPLAMDRADTASA